MVCVNKVSLVDLSGSCFRNSDLYDFSAGLDFWILSFHKPVVVLQLVAGCGMWDAGCGKWLVGTCFWVVHVSDSPPATWPCLVLAQYISNIHYIGYSIDILHSSSNIYI